MTKKTKNSTRRIREQCSCAIAPGQVSESDPVIRGCKILGLESTNKRKYLLEAVQKAVPLYEGKTVFIDHATDPEKPRGFVERFGKIVNVTCKEDGAYGDLHYNPRHALAETFRGWLEVDPASVGFSHDATGKVREESDGTLTITDILDVNSVDLVAVPATTKGLFEAHMNDDELMLDEQPDEVPAEEPAPVDAPAAGGVDEHLKNAAAAVFSDATLDTAAKLKKLKALLGVMDDEKAEEKKDTKEEDKGDDEKKDEKKDEDDKKTEESFKQIKDQLAALASDLKTVRESLPALHAKKTKSLPPAKSDPKALTVDSLIDSLR